MTTENQRLSAQLPRLIGLLGIALLAGCAYPSKVSFDSRMAELCKVDGGVKVFKTVTLPPEYFDKYGDIKTDPDSQSSSIAGRYAIAWSEKLVDQKGEHSLTLLRLVQTVKDTQSGELLAQSVRYVRRGGDSLSPNNTSNYCPKGSEYMVGKVFVKDER